MDTPPSDSLPLMIDQRLTDVYRAAYYRVNGYTLKIGHVNPDFDAWLTERGYRRYCFLTAHNPRSTPLPAPVNAARHRTLLSFADRLGIPYVAASGSSPSGDWPTEEGVCLFDCPLDHARELGNLYEQHALVVGVVGGPPELFWCAGD